MKRTALQVLAALTTVVTLYSWPWTVGMLGQDVDFEVVHLPTLEREAVVWFPAAEAEPAESIEDLTVDPVADATPTHDPPDEATNHPPSEPSEVVDAAPVDSLAVVASTAKKRVVRKRVVRKRVAKRAPRVLTKKDQRKKKKRLKRKERRAKRKQCLDHQDQIVRIDTKGNTETWLVGNELVGCFRGHPTQFMEMGGMAWAENDNGKKTGLKIYPSRRPRGDFVRRIGFQRGDVLTKFNGLPLKNMPMISLALMQLTRNKATIKFERKGEKHVFKVKVVDLQKLAVAKLEQEALAELEDRD